MRIPMRYYQIEQLILLLQCIFALYTLYLFGVTRHIRTRRGLVTILIFALALWDYSYIRWFLPTPQTVALVSQNFFWFGVRNSISLLYWERWVSHAWKMVKLH